MRTLRVSDAGTPDPSSRVSRPIPPSLKAPLDRLFGYDLSAVRIVESDVPESIGATAFAFGHLIHVRPTVDFTSPAGWWILGHELAHVVQQHEGRARAAADGVGVVDDDTLEREADRMGDAAVRAITRGLPASDGELRRLDCHGPFRPVIQCVMTVDEFRRMTATSGVRSLDRISKIDSALKAFHDAYAKKPRSYAALSTAAKKLYESAWAFKSGKPDSSRLPGVDRLIKEIVIEDAILSKLAEFEKETDELEKFKILETVQENFFRQRDRSELNNKTLENEIFTLLQQFLVSASNRGEAFVRRDIDELISIGKDHRTPSLLRSVIAECTAARNVQLMDAANGMPGLKYNTTRGATRKYSLSHAMEQSLGKRFRMGSLLHELTHLSIAESFDNTCLMLAVPKTASDQEILTLARSRRAKIQQLLAQIDSDLPEFDRLTTMKIQQLGVTRNRLYVEFKEKALYPISGKFANQYLRAFKSKMDPTEHARLVSLASQGLDCELIEYDTVINQMLLWAHLYDMDVNCGTYTQLEALVREAYVYRARARLAKMPPPRKPLPPLPDTRPAYAKKPLPPVPTKH